jgi:hypothetical protein
VRPLTSHPLLLSPVCAQLEASKAMRSERECCQYIVTPMLRVLMYLRSKVGLRGCWRLWG